MVIVPVVDQKLVPVKFVEEALPKREFPETVKAPPKYALPEEWTEKREPGEVVPMPTLPSLLTNKSELVAEVMFKAEVTPVALETFTERTADGEVEAMPILPSFLTKNNDVEAELMTLKALAVEVELDVEPAIVTPAKRPVEVPIPTLPERIDIPP